ncbi:MAG: porin [Luteolibacter sp.]
MKASPLHFLIAAIAACPFAHAESEEAKPKKSVNGDWCEWLDGSPGEFYEDKSNPWVQSFELKGRLHYQATHQDGNDVNGRDFHDTYDEYRRFRFSTRTQLLQYFKLSLDVNLVDDRRFRTPPGNDLDWGYDDFDTATLEFDLNKLFKDGPFDKLDLTYGKMSVPITEEQRQSSREIYTVERSMLSEKLAGAESRPTGITLEVEKADWSGTLGVFSGEDDADFLGGWNDGRLYFASISWQPDDDFTLTLDYVINDQSGTDDALGYRTALALGAHYDKKDWGFMASAMCGDNGFGDPTDSARNRANRQGDFHGFTVMPWYWVVQKKLQVVFRYEYASSEESEGLRLASRYLRGNHDDPLVDVNRGRGDLYHAAYLGLNYYICGDNAKVMGGILYEDLDTPKGDLDAFTYTVAVRTSF